MANNAPKLDRAWQATGEAAPLPAELRDRFERALGADLSEVRVHTGPAADAAARSFGADALACGSGLFFRAGAYRPEDPEGLRLLAHEVAHTVQQAEGRMRGGEEQADRFADAFLAGDAALGGPTGPTGPASPRHPRTPLRVAPGPSPAIQLHASFEHRFLGDGSPADVREIAARGPRRDDILSRQIRVMQLFSTGDPSKVTAAQIKNIDPGIITLTLGPEKLLATLGEVNALPDYLANPEQVDSIGKDVLLPILQLIRQECFNKFTQLYTGTSPNMQFPLSPYKPIGWTMVDNIVETQALDALTSGMGPAGQDHYRGLLARNACHFAPYSWRRWSTHNLIARNLAGQYYQSKNEELRRQALNYAGYADHFLEDSFAAGHLIDKTLVMQWFAEWAWDRELVADHDVLRYMTAALQPGLQAGHLYDMAYQGPSHDPQTVQELRELNERFRGTRTGPGREDSRLRGYFDYLTFLTSAVTQLASAELHDHYNKNALWVASKTDSQPYRIWGDDTLFTGADGSVGAHNTALAAALSRRAIDEYLQHGGSGISQDQVRAAFPTRVGSAADKLIPIGTWATGQKDWVRKEIFDNLWDEIKDLAGRLVTPRLGVVSRDEPLGEQWYAGLGETIVDHQADVLPADGRVFAASGGYAYELDARTGERLEDRMTELPHVGDFVASELAMDADYAYVGVSGHVHALPRHGAWDPKKPVWTTEALGRSEIWYPVSVLVVQDRLFAACHGYVYELDRRTGTLEQWAMLGDKTGVGSYPVTLATDGKTLFAGTHGFVYGLALGERWRNNSWHWVTKSLDSFLVWQPVAVLVHQGRLFAASNGWVYELSPGNGAFLKYTHLVDAGAESYYAHLATDGGRLYVGSHGRAYALPLNGNWDAKKAALWESERLSVLRDHGPATTLYLEDRLFVACDGYLYELDLLNGSTEQLWPMTTLLATGLDLTTTIRTSGSELYAGLHGYAYSMLLNHLQTAPTAAWSLVENPFTTQVRESRLRQPGKAANVKWEPLSALGGYGLFNGADSVVETANPVLDTTPGRAFTVEAWVRPDRLPTGGASMALSQSGRTVSAFSLGYSAGHRTWVFERAQDDQRQPRIDRVTADVPVTEHVWTHIAAVYDPDAVNDKGARITEMRIYVNGTRRGAIAVDPTKGFVSSAPFFIGVARYDGLPTAWFNGAVRDVRVHARALGDLRLDPAAAAFWRLDDDSDTVRDQTSNRHDADAKYVTWKAVPGVGTCATFDGIRSTITTKQPIVNTGNSGSFTVAAWARMDAYQSAYLLAQQARVIPAFSIAYQRTNPGMGIWNFVRPYTDQNGSSGAVVSSKPIQGVGTWTHVAATYDAPTGTMALYIDGVLQDTTNFHQPLAFDANGPFTIGYCRHNGQPVGYLPGAVRDVRVFIQALSATQVKAMLCDPGLSDVED